MKAKMKEDLMSKLPAQYQAFKDVFSRDAAMKLPLSRPGHDLEIQLKEGSQPPYKRYYPASQRENDAIRKWLADQLEAGIIRKSSSPAAAPVIVVRKPGGGLRVCVDYRGLNALTIKNRYPIPRIQETLTRLAGKKVFTKLDVIAAFNQLRVKEGHEWLTAFNTRYGQFECLSMPFGLSNAPSVFQAWINDVIRDMLDDFASAYLDDILIFSDNEEDHVRHVTEVLQRLEAAGLRIDINKCEFHVQETRYLGLIITPDGIKMDPTKVQAIRDWEVPNSVNDVQVFLGFANFYRHSSKDTHRLPHPLMISRRKNMMNSYGRLLQSLLFSSLRRSSWRIRFSLTSSLALKQSSRLTLQVTSMGASFSKDTPMESSERSLTSLRR
jgi:hypothetical protein